MGETGGTAGPEHTVRLVTPEDDMVMRPRLYEADPHTMRVPLDRILGPAGVRRTAAAVTAIDTARRTLTAVDRTGGAREIAYDGLVLATGSRLVRPEIPGAGHLHDVDTLAGATALDAHLHALPDFPKDQSEDRPEGTSAVAPARWTAVVVGSGATGLEVATELVHRLRTIAVQHGVDIGHERPVGQLRLVRHRGQGCQQTCQAAVVGPGEGHRTLPEDAAYPLAGERAVARGGGQQEVRDVRLQLRRRPARGGQVLAQLGGEAPEARYGGRFPQAVRRGGVRWPGHGAGPLGSVRWGPRLGHPGQGTVRARSRAGRRPAQVSGRLTRRGCEARRRGSGREPGRDDRRYGRGVPARTDVTYQGAEMTDRDHEVTDPAEK
nr:FAD-dependent oxidoreductase [Streptomyces sp. WAC04770]